MSGPNPHTTARADAMPLRALELFSGIGGFAAAVAGHVDLVAAYDQRPQAVETYELNFNHVVDRRNLDFIPIADVGTKDVDLWWMSPPCQPYTRRGNHADADDPRAACFLRFIDALPEFGPRLLAIENVPGFETSQTRERLVTTLGQCGYEWRERTLCPTQLGIPNRRARYYLTASKDGLNDEPELRDLGAPLNNYLDSDDDPALLVPNERVERFETAMRITDRGGYTTCFTGAYGNSPTRAGSYLRVEAGLRYFSPTEIRRLLHFPPWMQMPNSLTLRQQWKLLGNSLSVACVRHVLRALPGLETLPDVPPLNEH